MYNESESIVITGVSAITPYCSNDNELADYLGRKLSFQKSDDSSSGSSEMDIEYMNYRFSRILTPYAQKYMNSFRLGKMSKATILSIIAAKQAIAAGKIDSTELKNSGIILSSVFSTLDMAVDFFAPAVASQGTEVRSNKFANSVSCAPSGEVSAELGLTGSSWMFSEGILSSLDAIYMGCNVLSVQLSTPYFLVGGVEVYFQGKESFYAHSCSCENTLKKTKINEGVAVLLLEKKSHAVAREARIFGEIELIDCIEFFEKLKDERLREKTAIISNVDQIGTGNLLPNILLEEHEGANGAIGAVIACALLENRHHLSSGEDKAKKHDLSCYTQAFVYLRDKNSQDLGILIKGIH